MGRGSLPCGDSREDSRDDPDDLLCRCRVDHLCQHVAGSATKRAQKTFFTFSFLPNASSTASVSAFIAYRTSRGRKTKSGRNRTPGEPDPGGNCDDPHEAGGHADLAEAELIPVHTSPSNRLTIPPMM
jgi:hypothetical protein